ncbi:hypothetical protein VC83_08519 [Pseudogymnoascus destructans]|uniref:Major facilitator superfamily (MFS) profile domain-containing protein n=1 Tax=Pseudogymnoascus destructans TaxID=655981 RepID=A0A176ZYJ0_9PEZI|nr:uncharacterized protein VC83_08519 [Pseudogymnoascus destructans]OAF54976.1 hypothetical protein VC83_08519 [Pseudogymnoascus destructans]
MSGFGEESADETTQLLPKQAKTEPEKNSKIFRLWQVGALIGILLAYADTSLVWATHETIASRFNSLQNSSWMMTSFTMGYCVTLPLYGRLSDSYGSLRPLLVAYCTFCIGSTLCGIGQTYWQVILGRVVAGCGASGMVSLASIIITELADSSDVAVLRSYVNIASTIGLSGGGPLGGFLAGAIGWRWLFLGQVPIAAASCLLMAKSFEVMCPKVEQQEEQQREESVLAFDFPGAITLAIAISSLLAVIDLQGSLSGSHSLVQSLIVIGAISTLAFLVFETFPGNRELLMPLKLLKTEIGAFCAGQLLIVASGYGFVSQIAPYFANTRGASDAEGGGRTAPFSIGNAIGALLAGQIIKRFGTYKKLSIVSLFFCITNSVAILIRWPHTIGVWEGIMTTFPFGLFGGIALSAQFIGLYQCSSKQYMATAISMYYMSQQIGVALGISISSGLLKHQFHVTLQKIMTEIPGYTKDQIIQRILDDSSVVALLPEAIQSLIRQGYLASFWVVPVFVVSTQALTILPMISTMEKYSY